MASRKKKVKKCHCFAQAHSLKAGIKKCWKKGKDGRHKKEKQQNDRTVWKPAYPNDLTKDEMRKAMESLIFLLEKRDSEMKGRVRTNGSTQRSCIPKEEDSIPTVTTE